MAFDTDILDDDQGLRVRSLDRNEKLYSKSSYIDFLSIMSMLTTKDEKSTYTGMTTSGFFKTPLSGTLGRTSFSKQTDFVGLGIILDMQMLGKKKTQNSQHSKLSLSVFGETTMDMDCFLLL